MMNYYVYIHSKKSNGEVFYVGKGKDSRAFISKNKTKYWRSVVKKHDYFVTILASNLSEHQAFALEVFWIKLFGRKDLLEGNLVNLTNGGEGSSGFIQPQHVRDALANSNKKRCASKINREKTGSIFKGKFGFNHNRSKSVKCIETGVVYGSQLEAQRELKLGNGCVSWSIKNKKPIFGMHFETAI